MGENRRRGPAEGPYTSAEQAAQGYYVLEGQHDTGSSASGRGACRTRLSDLCDSVDEMAKGALPLSGRQGQGQIHITIGSSLSGRV